MIKSLCDILFNVMNDWKLVFSFLLCDGKKYFFKIQFLTLLLDIGRGKCKWICSQLNSLLLKLRMQIGLHFVREPAHSSAYKLWSEYNGLCGSVGLFIYKGLGIKGQQLRVLMLQLQVLTLQWLLLLLQ
jgi:hypothetical protein